MVTRVAAPVVDLLVVLFAAFGVTFFSATLLTSPAWSAPKGSWRFLVLAPSSFPATMARVPRVTGSLVSAVTTPM